MVIGKKQVATLVAEFLGAAVLTLVFLSVHYSTIGIPYFVALAAGVATAVAAYFFGDISGSHLNPAITLAVWTARKISTVTALTYIIVQSLGAWAAYGIYHYFVASTLSPVGGHYSARILFAEAIGAFVLALAWGAVYLRRYDATNRALLLGASYALAIIIAASAGIGIVNPAVALGVRAWAFAGSMGWGTYVLGPVLGAIIGFNLYVLIFGDSSNNVVESETLVITETVVPIVKTSARSKKRSTKTATKSSSNKSKTSARKR